LYVIILCIFNINYILLEISGSHSNIISDSYVFHYGNELVSHTGNKEIRHFVQQIIIKGTPLHGCALFLEVAGSLSNTKSPGLRPTSIPSGILVHPATTDIGQKLGGCAPLGDGGLGPHLTQCRVS